MSGTTTRTPSAALATQDLFGDAEKQQGPAALVTQDLFGDAEKQQGPAALATL